MIVNKITEELVLSIKVTSPCCNDHPVKLEPLEAGSLGGPCVERDADIAQIVFVRLLVSAPSLCLTSTGIVVATIARRRYRFHLSFGDYFKEVSYFSNAVWLLAIP